MALTTSVSYKEINESLEEGCNESGPWAKKTYMVAWTDRFQFCRDLRGLSSMPGVGGAWTLGVPATYDDPAAGSNMYARDLIIRPEGNVTIGSTPAQWSQALVTVTYGALSWLGNDGMASLSADPTENQALQYATQEIRWSADWYEVPNSNIKWQSDGTRINRPIKRPLQIIDMFLTWHRYPIIPFPTIKTYADSVNSSTFLGCDKGTVKFMGASTIREQTTDGTIVQKLQMAFKWRNKDWNMSLRESGVLWDTVADASGNPIIAYKDYGGLLDLLNPAA